MPSILSSRKLTEAQAGLLLNAEVSYVDYDALQIRFIDFNPPNPVENAIITSQNTVRALVRKNIWMELCFCVGEKTKRLLEESGFTVVEVTEYGKDLAGRIVQDYAEKDFVFFCGNKRRDEIPGILKANKVDFKEIQVYENQLNPKEFNREFDGILFFSPTQVRSYIENNKMKNQIAFCIGTTTAAEAKKYTDSIAIANTPTVESLIAKVAEVLDK